ncbi:hypothetical protein NS365_05485 [Aureimonas ureilytica]|uniref:HTH cro/C1-type domain-containing protein n=1 Tax=Aureimonas ureilytica TaxID=401562 RepID=A0A175RTP3_9HYPH|nr:hypothetical protein NS365_05485 [Aureimonas ureilytica]
MADEADIKKAGRPKGGTNARRAAGTTFAHLIALIGMTYDEAAAFLNISVGSIRSYASGARNPPLDVLDRLADLWERVSFRSDIIGPMPEPAHARREAIKAIRERRWASKRAEPINRSEG